MDIKDVSEIAAMHTEICSLTKENERLRIMLKNIIKETQSQHLWESTRELINQIEGLLNDK